MGAKVTLRSRIPEYARKARAQFAGAVRDTAYGIEAHAKNLAPVDEGHLRSSIEAKPTSNPLRWIVAVGAGYGIDVEFGTGPHLIRPVKGKFLRFMVGGKEVFAKVVRHPGTRSQPFLRPAVHHARPIFERRIAEVARSVK